MKRFPLEPLSRVRDLRLEAQQRVVTARRADLARAERHRDQVKTARMKLGERRDAHCRGCAEALRDPARLAANWLERADHHRVMIDSEIAKSDALLAAADDGVVRAQAVLDEELAKLRRARAKVDALQTYRGDWTSALQREAVRKEDSDNEELFRTPAHSLR